MHRPTICFIAAVMGAALLSCGTADTPPPTKVITQEPEPRTLTKEQIARIARLLIGSGQSGVAAAPAMRPSAYRPLFDIDTDSRLDLTYPCWVSGTYRTEGSQRIQGYLSPTTDITSTVAQKIIHEECAETEDGETFILNGAPHLDMGGTIQLTYSEGGTWTTKVSLTLAGAVYAKTADVEQFECKVDVAFEAAGAATSPTYSGLAKGTVCGEAVEEPIASQ